MNAKECLESRRSIRKYKTDAIPVDVLNEIVETAKYAPSWKNTQIARYHVVTNPELKAAIANDCVCGFTFNTKTLLQSPAIVIVSYVTKRCGYERDGSFTTSKGDRWEMFNAGIAAQTFCLAAHDKGIGTCIMGIFDDEKIAQVLNLPEEQIVAAVISAGYPDEAPEAPARKGSEVLLTRYE